MWLDGAPTPPYFTEAGFDDETGSINPENLLVPEDELNATVTRLDRMGVKAKMHVTGAGAAHAALNAIAAARAANPESTLRHELGHTNVVIPSDLGRFAELDAVAEFSPTVWQDYGRTLGSPARPAWQFNSILDRGALITVGTDWPVTTEPNVFPALQGMLARGDESVDLPSALASLTINGAIALGWDDEQGSIEPGKLANFIVLDRNLFEVPISEIAATRVLETVFEGRVVYSAQ
jgi:predicted amidohydrolase YtcJ